MKYLIAVLFALMGTVSTFAKGPGPLNPSRTIQCLFKIPASGFLGHVQILAEEFPGFGWRQTTSYVGTDGQVTKSAVERANFRLDGPQLMTLETSELVITFGVWESEKYPARIVFKIDMSEFFQGTCTHID